MHTFFDGIPFPATVRGWWCLESCVSKGDSHFNGAVPEPVHIARKRITGIVKSREIANQSVERCAAGALASATVQTLDKEGGLRECHKIRIIWIRLYRHVRPINKQSALASTPQNYVCRVTTFQNHYKICLRHVLMIRTFICCVTCCIEAMRRLIF